MLLDPHKPFLFGIQPSSVLWTLADNEVLEDNQKDLYKLPLKNNAQWSDQKTQLQAKNKTTINVSLVAQLIPKVAINTFH